MNNGYKKYNEKIYIKKIGKEMYLYNTETNIMRYQYSNENKSTIAEYQNNINEQEILRYEVVENNETIEKYTSDKPVENLSYYTELYKKIYEECSKIKKY